MAKASIVGTGSATPEKILTNLDLEGIVETSDEWITRRTGIKERHIASQHLQEKTSDLATRASLAACEMAGIAPELLEMIVVGTVTPDRLFPAVGCMVQENLGANRAAAFDLSAGCSGFLYGLSTAVNAIETGSCKNALVIGAERLSSVLDWYDRSTCVLMGDGAGAVVLSAAADGNAILSTHLGSDGSFWNLLYATERTNGIPSVLEMIHANSFVLKMEGNRLFKKAVFFLSEIAERALRHNSLTSAEIKLLIPHQANMRIISATAERLEIPMERVFTNIEKYGNTSSASIPIALDEAHRQGLISVGDHVMLVTFGAGLTWGASVIRWCLPKP